MKTNVYKAGLILFLLIALTTGCDDEFEKINTNPNAVTEIDDSYLFANAVLQTLRGDNYRRLQFPFAAQYAHVYSGQNNTMFIDRYYDNFTSAEYKVLFESFYYGPIRHIREVLDLTGTEGKAPNEVRHSMAQVVAIMNFVQAADAFGAIPYSEGGMGQDGFIYPKYDSVEFIYLDAIGKLKNIVSVLSTADEAEGYPGADPFFGNDLDKWTRFANSLRLRLAMRIRFVEPDKAKSIVAECLALPLMESNTENVWNENHDSDISELRNPVFEYYGYWKWKMSELFVETLKTAGDPRLQIFVKPNPAGEYVGIPNGLSDSEISKWTLADVSDPSDQLVGKAAPIYYMTAAEVWLLRAEAVLFGMGTGDANQFFQNGIRASFSQWNIEESTTETYLAENPAASLKGSSEEQFKQIATQLWIAVQPNAIEGWSTIRRTGYPLIGKRSAPTYDLGVTDGVLPTRCRYPSSEVNINHDNYMKALEDQGPDVISTKLWWDVRD